jgi:hypothetical protein
LQQLSSYSFLETIFRLMPCKITSNVPVANIVNTATARAGHLQNDDIAATLFYLEARMQGLNKHEQGMHTIKLHVGLHWQQLPAHAHILGI